MKPINLLVVDDHRLIIDGIKSMLEDVADIVVTAEAGNGEEAVELVRTRPDAFNVALMDISMPRKNGVETTREILALEPGLKVLALSMFEDEAYITSMLQAGAIGYVLKHTSKTELLQAIRTVALGDPYFGHDIARLVMARAMSGGSNPSAKEPQPAAGSGETELTEREQEILKLIAEQLTNQEIADKLFISPRTVHSHRRNLMQKLAVKNTAGLVGYAIKQGLV